jgi:hypothetical protein
MEMIMVDPNDKEPAEGSREVIYRELRRQGGTSGPQGEKGAGDKEPPKFFDIFDKNRLACLYQDKTKDGKISRFNKFVER